MKFLNTVSRCYALRHPGVQNEIAWCSSKWTVECAKGYLCPTLALKPVPLKKGMPSKHIEAEHGFTAACVGNGATFGLLVNCGGVFAQYAGSCPNVGATFVAFDSGCCSNCYLTIPIQERRWTRGNPLFRPFCFLTVWWGLFFKRLRVSCWCVKPFSSVTFSGSFFWIWFVLVFFEPVSGFWTDAVWNWWPSRVWQAKV